MKLTASRMHSDSPRITEFAVDGGAGPGAGMIGAIFNATLSSHVANMYSIPTDCPQREKRGR